MQRLFREIADAETALALSPEELGAKFLRYMREEALAEHNKRKQFSVYNIVLSVPTDRPGYGGGGCPHAFFDDLQQAYSEACGWLTAQNLLVPAPGNDRWHILSRRAFSFETDAALVAYFTGTHLLKENLHPTLLADAWLSFLRQDYATAIFQAMRSVEIRVRSAGQFSASDLGVSLMRKAFHKDTGPLTDQTAETSEKEALAALFVGAIGSYKNPHSNRRVPLEDPREAAEIISLASHLHRIVDDRAPN